MSRPVFFPDPVWGQLLTMADNTGVKVGDLIAAAAMELTGWETRSQRVQVLAVAGLPDAVIAERTGETHAFVGNARRQAGIPANRFERRTA